MKNVLVLGSTGSIGQSTLQVIGRHPRKFRLIGISAHSNIALLREQVRAFEPPFVCLTDAGRAKDLLRSLPPRAKKTKVIVGSEGMRQMIGDPRVDKVVLAISGSAALEPLLAAIECRREVALANKEALVMAGPIIMKMAAEAHVNIIPIDSEQSAIWQCLQGQDRLALRRIYLTASGGPFRRMPRRGLRDVSVARVLRHPRWKMGRKISVDSATLMNKGLELLEAMHLFGVPCEAVEVVVHPQAIVHSLVEFTDGSLLAQLSVTDMRIPIQYALSYPQRFASGLQGLGLFAEARSLTFERPDFRRFPCLRLAYEAARAGGTAPCVLNAADEVSVNSFLKGAIGFLEIPRIVEKVLSLHRNIRRPSLKEVFRADAWAREEARRVIAR